MDYKNWYKTNNDQAFKMSMAEFRGMTIQALIDIRKDIRNNRKDINNLKLVSATVGAVGGLVVSILSNMFGLRK